MLFTVYFHVWVANNTGRHSKPSSGRDLSTGLSLSTWTFWLLVNYVQWRKQVSSLFHMKSIEINSFLFVYTSNGCHKEQHQEIIKCIFIAGLTWPLALSHCCKKKYWGAVSHFVHVSCWELKPAVFGQSKHAFMSPTSIIKLACAHTPSMWL